MAGTHILHQMSLTLVSPAQALWWQTTYTRSVALAMDAATRGAPRDITRLLPHKDMAPSGCGGCTLLSAGSADDALSTCHVEGLCPVPLVGYSECEECGLLKCADGCANAKLNRVQRAHLCVATLMAFGVTDVASPLALQIMDSVPVWRENGIGGLVNKKTLLVDGVTMPTLSKRSVDFTGFLVVQTVDDMTRWTPCTTETVGAISLPGLVRKYGAVALAGYQGNVVPVRKHVSDGQEEEEEQNKDNATLLQENKSLQLQLANLRHEMQRGENLVEEMTREREHGQSLFVSPAPGPMRPFRPAIAGSKHGAIDQHAALRLGKVFLTFENVLSSMDAVPNAVASMHVIQPGLSKGCEPGKNKEIKLRVAKFPPGIAHLDLPPNLEQEMEAKFSEFENLLRQYASEAAMCKDFYKAKDFMAVLHMLEMEAQRKCMQAISNYASTGGDVQVVKCSTLTIVLAADGIIRDLLYEAFNYGWIVNTCDPKSPTIMDGLNKMVATVTVPPTAGRQGKARNKREPTGQRPEEGQATQKAMTGKERRAKEVCFKFNDNEPPCAGKQTCPLSRRHVCRKCGENHAQSLTPTCKEA